MYQVELVTAYIAVWLKSDSTGVVLAQYYSTMTMRHYTQYVVDVLQDFLSLNLVVEVVQVEEVLL